VSGSWCYIIFAHLSAIVTFSSFVLNWILIALVVGGNDAGHTMFSAGGYALALISGIVLIPIVGILKKVMFF
jgi:hypothetical protein